MVRLTDYEQRMLNGEFGEFKQVALQKIINYANVLGAEELVEVKKATIYLGAHPYLDVVNSDDYDEVFSKMYLCSDQTVPLGKMEEGCFCQTCVTPCSHYEYEPLFQTKEYFDKNAKWLELVREAGVMTVSSCTPYFTGWVPLKGEHFVTTESSNLLLCNSVFAACGNSDGIEAAAWSGVCGRTPLWGLHLPENRYGDVVFNIEPRIETIIDWDVLGYTIGHKLMDYPNSIPILQGNISNPTLAYLKQCYSAMATTSGAEMCHIVGFTPEAPDLETALGGKEPLAVINITDEDMRESWDAICDKGEGPVNFIALGCPHYNFEEVCKAAAYCKGKKIADGVNFAIWTDYSTREMAKENGLLDIVREAGGDILTSSCPLVAGGNYLEHCVGFVTDGSKQAHYIRSSLKEGVPVFYGNMYKCIDAAVLGYWKED